jgi:pimeloyl-ACP methyl ester carboxylesterase
MAKVEIQGAALECVESGAGAPIVLVHGSASDLRTWQGQREPLARRHHVIAYSRRYHWPNEPIADGADYSMAQHVDDLQALLRTLNAVPAHLVGHSYGAFLCLLLALRDPVLVRSLVLAEPPAITRFVSSEPKPWELLKVMLARPRTASAIVRFGAQGVVPARKAFRQGDPEAAVRSFADAVFGPGGFERMPEGRRRQVQDNLSNIKAEILGPGFAPLRGKALRALRVPVLLVTGEHSMPLFQCLIDRLAELLPSTQRVQIPGASHAMHDDNPSAFNAAVLRFLDGMT